MEFNFLRKVLTQKFLNLFDLSRLQKQIDLHEKEVITKDDA